jgi:hypothetical protein
MNVVDNRWVDERRSVTDGGDVGTCRTYEPGAQALRPPRLASECDRVVRAAKLKAIQSYIRHREWPESSLARGANQICGRMTPSVGVHLILDRESRLTPFVNTRLAPLQSKRVGADLIGSHIFVVRPQRRSLHQ